MSQRMEGNWAMDYLTKKSRILNNIWKIGIQGRKSTSDLMTLPLSGPNQSTHRNSCILKNALFHLLEEREREIENNWWIVQEIINENCKNQLPVTTDENDQEVGLANVKLLKRDPTRHLMLLEHCQGD